MKKDEKREMLIDMVEKYLDAEQLEKFKSSFNSESKKTFIKQKKYTFSLDEINNLGLKQIDEQNYSYKNEIKISHSLLYNLGVIYPLDYSSNYIIKAIKDYLPSYPLVLDMCAAPGGKSISLSFLKEDALITSYDISYSRVLEMIKNVDRSGLNNIFINSIDPLKLNYFETFDFIILDAPCSGSGMFRKEEKMLDDLTEKKIQKLLPIQKDLLKKAVTMVKKGGYILYSTCSFSIDEDEKQVEKILKTADIEEIKLEVDKTVIKGKYGYHLIPGIFPGEGIYFALLRKKGETTKESRMDITEFNFNSNTYSIPYLYKSLTKQSFIRPGIAKYSKEKYPKCEFDHPYCKVDQKTEKYDLSFEECQKIYKGEEINSSSTYEGLLILTYKNIPITYASKKGNRIKNYLPKYLRTNIFY